MGWCSYCRQVAMLALALLISGPVQAYVVNINPGPQQIYLRVGDGAFNGYYTDLFGSPANLATINKVSVTVPAAALGNSVAQPMTSNATQGESHYEGYAFCNVPQQVYIGGYYRSYFGGNARLSVDTPANLANGAGGTIPISQVSWTSSGNGDTGGQPVPAGTFTGGNQFLVTFQRNTWRESCLTFRYANQAVAAAGVYTGRARYTLTSP